MPPEEMRDAISAALDAADPPSAIEPSSAALEPAPAPSPEPSASAESKPGTIRDALGRFVKPAGAPEDPPAAQAADPAAQTAAPPAADPAAAPAEPEVKPPQSWTPAAREVWASVPPQARQEIQRRETEIQRALQETSAARSIAQQFSEAVTPYIPRMQMQGATPIQALTNLLQIETTLGTGTQHQRAETIAKLVKAYDIDIAALDSALAGAPVPEDVRVQSTVQQLVQQEMSPIREFMRTMTEAQNARAQQYQQNAATELETFAKDPKHEFFEDVREDMADLIEVASRRGQELSLEQAYQAAVIANPRTRGVAEGRMRAQQAASLTATATRAKAAAVSLSSSPIGDIGGGADPQDLRGQIAASIASLSRT